MLILRGPRKNVELTHGAEEWRALLADPDEPWKDGRSAKMLAEAWESAAPGLPRALREAFTGTPSAAFDPIPAIPEHEVDLPRGRRPSQNDLSVAGRLERVGTSSDPELWVGCLSEDAAGADAPGPTPVTVHQRRASTLPHLIAHADWGSDPQKRWMCVAEVTRDEGYHIGRPEPARDPATLLRRLRERANGATVAVGFDFPIGVPWEYARRAGIRAFLDVLPELGHDRWADFYTVASTPEDISLTRPFYPMRPGGTKQRHLTDALGVDDVTDLLRACERPTEKRGTASPLFWTMGGTQVGKAAILGWREIVGPALRNDDLEVSIWPFDGDFAELVHRGGIVIAETYPAEACLHLGLTPPGRGWSNRRQEGRREQRELVEAWARRRPVQLDEELRAQIEDGFGASRDAEDRFDSMVGLLSMVEVALGYREDGAPKTVEVRKVEGWILGQKAPDLPTGPGR